MRDEYAKQRRFTQMKPVVTRIEARTQLLANIAIGCIEVDLLDDESRAAPHHLHRFG